MSLVPVYCFCFVIFGLCFGLLLGFILVSGLELWTCSTHSWGLLIRATIKLNLGRSVQIEWTNFVSTTVLQWILLKTNFLVIGVTNVELNKPYLVSLGARWLLYTGSPYTPILP